MQDYRTAEWEMNASEEAAVVHWIFHGDGTRSLVSG